MLFTVGFPHIFVRGWLSLITQWLGRILQKALVLHLLERGVSGTTCKGDVAFNLRGRDAAFQPAKYTVRP